MNPWSERPYLRKHGLPGARIEAPPHPGLALVVVIPCREEPALVATLASLAACEPPAGEARVEVIVVVNGSAADDLAARRANEETLAEARAWAAARAGDPVAWHVLERLALPPRHAGVGLARKVGMDEAVARLAIAGRPRGVIACLDADCTVERSYLRELCAHFERFPGTPGCSVHFEHPLPAAASEPGGRQRAGIVGYELGLRYYVHALRWCGFPHAFHTVGSSLAVRADAYERQGGMNRRQAGEDFYFLGKIIPRGPFTELTATTVLPSARVSHRVPFGTGRAVGDWLAADAERFLTYDPAIFRDLGALFPHAGALHAPDERGAARLEALPPRLRAYLDDWGLAARLAELRANVASAAVFERRFFDLVDAFRVLKYVHFASGDTGELRPAPGSDVPDDGRFARPRIPVERAAVTLLDWIGLDGPTGEPTAEALLERYRRLDRTGEHPPTALGAPAGACARSRAGAP